MERCALYWSVCGIATDMGARHVVLCFIIANRDAKLIIFVFLNQARATLWPAHTWFPKFEPVWTSECVCVFVCVSAPEAINN